MILSVIVSLLLLAAYIAYAVGVVRGIPSSVSDTYYRLEKRGKRKGLFQLAMIVPAMLLLPAWLECSGENIRFLAFLSCGGLIFVGAAPLFKLELEGRVHYSAAAVCGISAILWVCLSGMWIIPLAVLPVVAGMGIRYRKWVFWIECAAFAVTYLAVLLVCAGR